MYILESAMVGLSLFFAGLFGMALVIVGARFGFSLKRAKDYFTGTPEGRGAWGGVVKFVGIAAVAGILIFGARKAFADEQGYWFKSIEIYAGADRTGASPSVFCASAGIDNKTTSNGGVNIAIYQFDGFKLLGTYQHHSCAFNQDVITYDGTGIRASYTFDIHSLFGK